jgi:hypothetical protein
MTNEVVLVQTEKVLRLKNYSRKTAKSYIGHSRRFMEHYKQDITGLTGEQVSIT